MKIQHSPTRLSRFRSAALGLAATTVLLACGNGEQVARPGAFGGFGAGGGVTTALPVVTVPVAIGTVSSFLVATTTLSAERAVDVSAGASGPVATVLVEEGDSVVAGDLLASIESNDALLSLREAQTHYDNSKRSYDRTATLAARNVASSDDVEQQRYDLEIREFALLRAQQQLEDTQIRAPIDGVVALRSVQPGTNVSANTTLFSVVDLDPLLAIVHVPEVSRSQVRVGQAVTVSTEGGIDASGVVQRISPVVDAGSGTVKVTVVLSGRLELLPGMFVTVRVPVLIHTNVMVIPKRAVLIERNQNVVYRVGESEALRSPVELGLSSGDVVEVLSGLSRGDRIVTVGQESLRDGMAVREAGEPVALAADADSATGDSNAAPVTRGGGGAAGSAANVGRAGQGGEARGGRFGGFGGGNFDLSQMPEQQRLQIEQRLLENEQVKAAYEKQLQEDPELENDADKRADFFTKQLEEIGGPRALFAAGGGFGGRTQGGGGQDGGDGF